MFLTPACWVRIPLNRLTVFVDFFSFFWKGSFFLHNIWNSEGVALKQILDLQLETYLKFVDMIPTKMLVYRGPDGGTRSETISDTRRRKKSTGELFQKGYRVRMGHGQVTDKEDQDSICYSLGACFHVISYWGKTCRIWKRGESPLKLSPGMSRTLWTLCVSWSSFRICSVLHFPSGKHALEMRKSVLAMAHHGSRHFVNHYLFHFFVCLFFLAEWLPVTSLICVIWHPRKSMSAGEFVSPINECGDGFYVIAHF